MDLTLLEASLFVVMLTAPAATIGLFNLVTAPLGEPSADRREVSERRS